MKLLTIFYIHTGELPYTKAKAYLEELKNEYTLKDGEEVMFLARRHGDSEVVQTFVPENEIERQIMAGIRAPLSTYDTL